MGFYFSYSIAICVNVNVQWIGFSSCNFTVRSSYTMRVAAVVVVSEQQLAKFNFMFC